MTGLLRLHPAAALLLLAAGLLLTGCAGRRPVADSGVREVEGHAVEGRASWYGPGFHGRKTASGEVFDSYDLTCAHRTLPFGTRVLVRNLDNGKTCWVRVNDRGPFIAGRVIDLSYSAALALDVVRPGTAKVALEVGRETLPSAGVAVARVQSERLERLETAADVQAVPVDDPAPAGEAFATGTGVTDVELDALVDDGIAVQVGAFALRENAERLAADLARRGIDARVHDDGRLHRVRVGRLAGPGEATQLAEVLRHDGFEAIVVGD